ncbi:MAG TPA: hypothetical protein VGF86_04780 [Candidatus Tumulicola sp.]
MRKDDDRESNITRGIRLDLAIAVCALLISTLATGASWWQARVMQAQTKVLEEQLGAQVWPYVGLTGGIDGDTVAFSVSNDGLGPAVLRSLTAFVDGVPKGSFTEILHALLGEHLVARRARGEKIRLTIDSAAPGSVIRPGERSIGFALTSKRFARPFLKGYNRLNFRICYCAILPGKCWRRDSAGDGDPKPVAFCPIDSKDLLHASGVDELTNPNF